MAVPNKENVIEMLKKSITAIYPILQESKLCLKEKAMVRES
jgi:hypothetical protein